MGIKKISFKKCIIIFIIIVIIGVVGLLLILNNSNETEQESLYDINYKKYLEEYGYSKGEIYTGFSYVYITSNNSNNEVKDVSYTRYVYKNNDWVLAQNESPLFSGNR